MTDDWAEEWGPARPKRGMRGPLALLTLISGINVSHQFLLAATFPLLKVEFRLSDAALGVLGSTYLILAAVFVLPFAVLADRYRRTRIIGWGTLVWGVSTVWSGLANSFAELLAARSLLGVSDPADNPTSYSLLTDYYPVEQRGKVFGIYNTGQLLGLFALPIAGLIADNFGWRAAFFFWAIPGFVLAALAWRMAEPERGHQDRAYQNLETLQERESIYDRMNALRGYLVLLKIPTVDIALFTQACTTFFTRGLGVWLATFFVRYHDMSITTAASSVAVLALGSLAGSLGGGYFGDHLVDRGLRSGRIALAGLSITLSVALFVPTFATGNTGLMFLLFVIGAMLLFPGQPLLNAATANVIHPKLRGRGASADWIVQTSAGALGVLVFGVMAEVIGLRSTFLAVLPLVMLGGLVPLFLGPRFLPRDEDRMREELAAESVDVDAGDDDPPPPPPAGQPATVGPVA